jgi:uncharacterized protein
MKRILLITLAFFLVLCPLASAEVRFNEIHVPAVSSEGFGIMTQIDVEILPGKGRVLVNAIPLTGIETQNSERVAVDVASEYTGYNFSNDDVIFTIHTEANVVDGPSAGAALTVATIAAVEGKQIKDDVTLTGTIEPDGSIGPVGNIFEKAKVAAEHNYTTILIPRDQEFEEVTREVVESPMPGWDVTRTESMYVNVPEYLEKKYNITAIPVFNIKNVAEILLEEEPETIVYYSEELPHVEITPEIAPMTTLVDYEIEKAEQNLMKAGNYLSNSTINDTILEYLHERHEVATDYLGKAAEAREHGYLYGAANFAFKSNVQSGFIIDMVQYEQKDDLEKTKFVGNRLTEVNSQLIGTRLELINVNRLSQDRASFEWAIASQQRFAQAEERFEVGGNNTLDIFYSLRLIEEWSDIASQFNELAEGLDSRKYFDSSIYYNNSIDQYLRAKSALFRPAGATPYTQEWYIAVAEREFDKDWYVASYLDSSIALTRVETGLELNTRSWENLAADIEEEIRVTDVGDSAWGKLYKDYAALSLHYAKTEQDEQYLEDALIYIREAKLYAETQQDLEQLPDASVYEIDKTIIVGYAALVAAGIVLCIIFILNPQLLKKPKARRRA